VKFISIFSLPVTPLFKHGVPTSFVPGCCWLAVFLLRTAGKQQQSSKPIRSYTESGIAPIDHSMFKKIMKGLKNILQSLCTHSAFLLSQYQIFVQRELIEWVFEFEARVLIGIRHGNGAIGGARDYPSHSAL
jgi:hypothetical protein